MGADGGSISDVPASKPDSFYKNIYMWLNPFAVLVHVCNLIGIIVAYSNHLQYILPGYAFVSPTVPLRWTNHALVWVESSSNKCSEVTQSPHFQATLRNEASFPPRQAYVDFTSMFNFTGTDIIEYNMVGSEIDINVMLMCFCGISVLFQFLHQGFLWYYPQAPRFMHYLEYSISSSLMAMIMAVEVGIVELFAVTSIGGLFFGMNIAGMCAETMAHYSWKIGELAYMCILTHVAGWVMFFLAMVPIWSQFHMVLKCSENGGTPLYIYILIIIESFLFFVFGFLQVASLVEKMYYTDSLPEELLFRYDCFHAMLSVVAKTLLVWLLVAPALSVDLDVLVDRVSFI